MTMVALVIEVRHYDWFRIQGQELSFSMATCHVRGRGGVGLRSVCVWGGGGVTFVGQYIRVKGSRNVLPFSAY